MSYFDPLQLVYELFYYMNVYLGFLGLIHKFKLVRTLTK